MAYQDTSGRLVTWLHRCGIARRINSSYAGRRGWYACTVDTALPSLALAGIANRPETPRLVERKRLGRWQWRWTFERVT